MRANRVIWLAVVILLLGFPLNGRAGVLYTFTKIADTSGAFAGFLGGPAVNNNGTVAFWASLKGGSEGIFTGNGGPTTTIIDASQGFSSTGSTWPSINDAGAVAFVGALAGIGTGVFVGSGGPLTTIAAAGDPFSGIVGAPAINNSGTVAFYSEQGIFTSDGTTFANIASPGSFSGITAFPSLNDAGTVAFVANSFVLGNGVFIGSAGPTTPIVLSTGPFSDLAAIALINDAGTVAFWAHLVAGGEGIFTSNGTTLTTVVDTSGPFSHLQAFSLNNVGTVAFGAALRTGGDGLFTGPDPVADKVLATGDPLFGSTVTLLGDYLFKEGLNDKGQIAFFARLANGVYGIFRADPALIEVPFDIKPQACPNPLNVKSPGVLSVAILGTAEFDVTRVDPASIKLSGVPPLRLASEDVGTPFVPFVGKTNALDCTTTGPDGFLDLTLEFDNAAIVSALGPVTDGEVLVLQVTGNLKPDFGGTPIIGEDVVVILSKVGRGPH